MALPIPASRWTLEQIKNNGRDHAAYNWSTRPHWYEWSKEQLKAYFEAYYERSDEVRAAEGKKPLERDIDRKIEEGLKYHNLSK